MSHLWPSPLHVQCESKKSPLRFFWHFFPNGWAILINFSHAYYAFTSVLDCKFLFNYLQFWRSYAILSETTHRIFDISLELNLWVGLLSKWWRRWWHHVISNMFVDIIKAADLGWFATNNGQQSHQRLSQTSKRVRFGRCCTFWAYYVNWVVALNMA